MHRMSRRSALGLMATAGAGVVLPCAAGAEGVALPKAPLRYLVFVDGSRSGTYNVEFVPRAGGFTATSAMSIRVEVAFITAYRYQQDGQEDWHDGRLMGFEYLTNDNGKTALVGGARQGEMLAVTGPKGAVTIPGDALCSGFWNHDIVRARHLVDPQTAELVPLGVQKLGEHAAQIAKHSIRGAAYALDTFLKGTIWFDAHDRLLASSFMQDGHKVELRRA